MAPSVSSLNTVYGVLFSAWGIQSILLVCSTRSGMGEQDNDMGRNGPVSNVRAGPTDVRSDQPDDDVLLRPAYYIAITSGRERDHSLYQHNQYDCLLFIRTELSMADGLHSTVKPSSCY